MRWACGVTTVLDRKDTTLPITLRSLCDAGFGDPHLFVDGCDDASLYKEFGCPVSVRGKPPLKVVGNWMISLWEMNVRYWQAERFVLFQDDILAVGNLRAYLERCEFPSKGYLNLYTFSENRQHTENKPGWNESNQRGLGALGLVFNWDGMTDLLSSGHMARKPASAQRQRAWKALDGGVVDSLKLQGYKEYVHNPSLLQHIGVESSLGNRPYPGVDSFPGEEFDALKFFGGEGFAPPKPVRPRDAISVALEATTVDPEKVYNWLGSCVPDRPRKLVRLNAWANRIIKGSTERAEEYLNQILEDF